MNLESREVQTETVKGLAVDHLSDSKPDDYYWIERRPKGAYIFYASIVDVPAVLEKKMPQDLEARRLLRNEYVDERLVSRILDPRFIDEHFNPKSNEALTPQVMVMRIEFDDTVSFDDSNVAFYSANLIPQGYLNKPQYDEIIRSGSRSLNEHAEQLKLWIELASKINRKRIQKVPFDLRGVGFGDVDSRFTSEYRKVIGEFKFLMRIQATKFMRSVAYGSPAIYLHPEGDKSTFQILKNCSEVVEVHSLSDDVRRKIINMPLYDVSPFVQGNESDLMVPAMEWGKPLRDYVSITNLRRLYKAIHNGEVTDHDWRYLQRFCAALNADILNVVTK